MVAVKCQLYSGGTINYNCFNEKQFWIFWWFMIWFFFVFSMHVCQSKCVQIDNRMWLQPGMPLLLWLSNRYNKNVYFFSIKMLYTIFFTVLNISTAPISVQNIVLYSIAINKRAHKKQHTHNHVAADLDEWTPLKICTNRMLISIVFDFSVGKAFEISVCVCVYVSIKRFNSRKKNI